MKAPRKFVKFIQEARAKSRAKNKGATPQTLKAIPEQTYRQAEINSRTNDKSIPDYKPYKAKLRTEKELRRYRLVQKAKDYAVKVNRLAKEKSRKPRGRGITYSGSIFPKYRTTRRSTGQISGWGSQYGL